MEEKDNKKEYIETPPTENPYDPLVVARREGQVFGLGASGNYRKNFVTRAGFILLGLVFLGTGFGTYYAALNIQPLKDDDYIIKFLYSLFGVLTFVLGLLFIKNSVKKVKSNG
jgi:hypothetical protein